MDVQESENPTIMASLQAWGHWNNSSFPTSQTEFFNRWSSVSKLPWNPEPTQWWWYAISTIKLPSFHILSQMWTNTIPLICFPYQNTGECLQEVTTYGGYRYCSYIEFTSQGSIWSMLKLIFSFPSVTHGVNIGEPVSWINSSLMAMPNTPLSPLDRSSRQKLNG